MREILTTVGIGDIITYRYLLDSLLKKNGKIRFIIPFTVVKENRNNADKYLDFIFKFAEKMLVTPNSEVIKGDTENTKKNITNTDDLLRGKHSLKIADLTPLLPLPPLDPPFQNVEYIVVTTKCRGLLHKTFLKIKADFFDAILKLSRRYKIVLMGERTMTINPENKCLARKSKLFVFYEELMTYLNENQIDCIDLTVADCQNDPDEHELYKDIAIMKHSVKTICLGYGGNMVIASITNKVIAYTDTIPYILQRYIEQNNEDQCITANFIEFHDRLTALIKPIPMYIPYIENYTTTLIESIKSSWVSSCGEYIEKSASLLSDINETKYVILTNNGTSATHCLFVALKRFHPHIQKIYVPNNVYVAAWNAALYEYPPDMLELMPIDEQTWNIPVNEEYFQSLEKGAAVLIVHNVGNIVNVPYLHLLTFKTPTFMVYIFSIFVFCLFSLEYILLPFYMNL